MLGGTWHNHRRCLFTPENNPDYNPRFKGHDIKMSLQHHWKLQITEPSFINILMGCPATWRRPNRSFLERVSVLRNHLLKFRLYFAEVPIRGKRTSSMNAHWIWENQQSVTNSLKIVDQILCSQRQRCLLQDQTHCAQLKTEEVKISEIIGIPNQ